MTQFTDGQTVVNAAWLNGVDKAVNQSGTTAGAALISYTPPGTGAVATTVAAFLGAFHQYPSGYFFSQNGAFINRVNDRLFVGDATLMTGNSPGSGSWIDTYSNTFAAGNYYNTFAQAIGMSSVGAGVMGASQTATGTTGANAYGIVGIGIANNSLATFSWGGYFEGHRAPGATTSNAWCLELGIVNRDSVVDLDPYGPYSTAGATIGIQLNSGSGFPTGSGAGQMSGQANTSAAMVIQSNPTKHRRGIVFTSSALDSTNNEAMSFANGHKLQWYSAGSTPTSGVAGTNSSQTNAVTLSFNDTFGFQVNRALDGKGQFAVIPTANAVNFIYVTGAVTGAPPGLVAYGTDAAVDLTLATTGTAYVRFGSASHFSANGAVTTALTGIGPTGSHTTVQEWLTIKNSSGIIRYIPCF